MRITSVFYTAKFNKKLKNFPTKDKVTFLKKFQIFLDNPFEPPLKTHKLTGKLEDYWSFSLNYSTRVLFRFVTESAVEFIDLGGHDIYR
ncbi:type II toxin-antitoxin system mRNA interferase toxin, RelE/StbE family [Candidatus Parcubacteria bacterium]|nr:type II toxin-antitoxin system mRNA interferase toxin, RelE/StbE family [Patescibacteria group bacterium]MBU4381032.1 type II toxin-antitoxin system mRNA interferase toxin, RelE/StbE family [Patescibacteria group bacterium]MCG2689065.1 type II toxin-antitoxin system mRNA interferase toxin, RelE/StbE family [Candidatus Parcubacteria bacterium]